MKKLFVILLLPIIIILSSCISVDIAYQVTQNNQINIDYTVTLCSTEKDISEYANEISAYWTDTGFITTVNKFKDDYTIIGQKNIDFGTKQQVASAFSALLTADNSIFYNVVFEYIPSYTEDTYSLSANISLKDIIRQSEEQNIPATEVKEMQTNAQNGKYTISIALPGNVVSTNADQQENLNYIWHLMYGEEKQISIQTKQINQGNITYYQSLQDTDVQDTKLLCVCCIAIGILFVAITISLVIRRVLKNRTLKVRVKKFR